MTHTHQTVHDLLQARWESDLPDRIITALRPYAGKNITTRLLEVLPGGRHEWRMQRKFGWTELTSANYARTGGREDMRLILARTESSVPLDLALVERENPAWFAGRRERNHARMEAMNTKAALDAMADAMNAVQAAQAALARATEQFAALTEHDAPFNADRYELERACGLRQESK